MRPIAQTSDRVLVGLAVVHLSVEQCSSQIADFLRS